MCQNGLSSLSLLGSERNEYSRRGDRNPTVFSLYDHAGLGDMNKKLKR